MTDVVLSRAGPMTLVFCSLVCKIDYHNGVTRYSPVADRNLYGCWQCGENLLQGMLLDMPLEDNHLWRHRPRAERKHSLDRLIGRWQ